MFNMFRLGRGLYFDDGEAGGGEPETKSQETQNATGSGGTQTQTDPNKSDVRFTQKDLDKYAGDARIQARKSALNDVLGKAGFQSEDELYAAIEAHKKSEDEKLSAQQKAEKSAAESKTRIEQLEAENLTLKLQMSFEKKAKDLKVEFASSEAAQTAFALLDKALAGGGEEKGMDKAIQALQDKHPYLFIEAEPEETDATKKGTTKSGVITDDRRQELTSRFRLRRN